MPTHGTRIAAIIAALVVFACAAPSAADPILVIVTSGVADFNPVTTEGGLIQLAGTDGFTLVAFPQSGNTGPNFSLQPGTTTSFFGAWSGNDLPGTATLLGETFTNLGALDHGDTSQASIAFQSSAFTLPSTGGNSLTITAPFTLTGTLHGVSPNGTVDADFISSGIGMLPLMWIPGNNAWDPGIVQMQVSTPETVPEPASIALLGVSLAGAYGAKRRRRRSAATHEDSEVCI